MTGAVLTILDGLQAGSQLRLPNGSSRVGSGLDCAVIVADPALQREHFEIVVGDVTAVHALQALTLPNGKVVAASAEIAIDQPICFTAGGTRFLLDVLGHSGSPAAAPAPKPTVWSRGRGALSAGVLGLAAAGGLGIWLGAGGQPRSADAVTVAMPRPPLRHADVSAAAAALRVRLASAGLGGIAVAPTGEDGTVGVSGLLLPDEQGSWNQVRQWFDGRFGNNVVVVENFSAPGALPPLRIAAVWSGPQPYVVDEHGDRLHAGAAVGDGWSVDRIDDGHVIVRRGAQTVSLRY